DRGAASARVGSVRRRAQAHRGRPNGRTQGRREARLQTRPDARNLLGGLALATAWAPRTLRRLARLLLASDDRENGRTNLTGDDRLEPALILIEGRHQPVPVDRMLELLRRDEDRHADPGQQSRPILLDAGIDEEPGQTRLAITIDLCLRGRGRRVRPRPRPYRALRFMAEADGASLQRFETLDGIHGFDQRNELLDALRGPVAEELFLERGLRCEVVIERPLRHTEAVAQRGDGHSTDPS